MPIMRCVLWAAGWEPGAHHKAARLRVVTNSTSACKPYASVLQAKPARQDPHTGVAIVCFLHVWSSGRAAQTACMTGLNTACRRTAAGAAVALPPDNQPRILGRRSLLFATSHAALSLLLSAFLLPAAFRDRKSTRLNSSHVRISYAVHRDLHSFPTRRSSDLFWQGRPDRLHDRLEYRLQTDGSWSRSRLAP